MERRGKERKTGRRSMGGRTAVGVRVEAGDAWVGRASRGLSGFGSQSALRPLGDGREHAPLKLPYRHTWEEQHTPMHAF